MFFGTLFLYIHSPPELLPMTFFFFCGYFRTGSQLPLCVVSPLMVYFTSILFSRLHLGASTFSTLLTCNCSVLYLWLVRPSFYISQNFLLLDLKSRAFPFWHLCMLLLLSSTNAAYSSFLISQLNSSWHLINKCFLYARDWSKLFADYLMHHSNNPILPISGMDRAGL